MEALIDATDQQMATLCALVDMVQSIEDVIGGLQPARDGVLALASRWAIEVAQQGEHPDLGDMTTRSVAAELGAALRMSDRTVQRRMADAEFFVTRYPLVWAAQGAGRISAAHARVIVEAGAHLEHATDRDAYADTMIATAEVESPNRLARIARRAAERFQPRTLDERHADAREQRRVWIRDAPDGMAELGLLGPAALVQGAFERLTGMAKAVQAQRTATWSGEDAVLELEHDAGSATDRDSVTDHRSHDHRSHDERSLDLLRADVALDVLLSGVPLGHDGDGGVLGAIRAHVSVTVPVMTLLESTQTPAELDGRRPVDARTARALAAAAPGWDRVLTHPITGAVLAVDRYRPGADLRRHLRARDQRCRFPGCGRSPDESDIDHTHDAALGGATREENLAHLCRRHHMLKHHSPWHIERLDAGLFAWTSPSGRTYIDRPQPPTTVTFVEDDATPPF
ncbi:hypothetical protein SRABI76_03065 [Microbacterium oxydans]|uniref:HNH endonuclease signature motif containing protein n=1 Tax=Microbacterium oxydans TaxID=82380 RepID=UPI001DB449F9|nr:HNH endonuclease signature motif containing protein [Microbacterium oxydans]CAH0243656.1 hypothetical protein SRABI76_03065 [Microbacterium oxydans]